MPRLSRYVPPRLVLLAALSVSSAAAADDYFGSGGETEEIIVTATRQEKPAGQVPASATVFGRRDMEALDVKSFADLARYTPGVTFDPATHAVAIRGIGSTAGAGTTGIYIDDTPVQMRSLYYNSNNVLPTVFDLDRIEVLRGPQGTLFGAGSEGGTIRYVTAQPDLNRNSLYGRSEVTYSDRGQPSYETGVALGGPIADGKLGFRFSVWGRRDGGWIDQVDAASGASVIHNGNWADTYVARAAVTWAPNANLEITPSLNFQNHIQANADQYWVALSDAGAGRLQTATPERLADHDHFFLPGVSARYAMGSADLVATAAYFDRAETVGGYSATLYNLSYFQRLLDPSQDGGATDPMLAPCAGCRSDLYPLLTPTGPNLPGFAPYQANSVITNTQRNFTSEVRLQSKGTSRLTWVVGAFYGDNRQESIDTLQDPQLPGITQYLFGEGMADAWGMDLLPDAVGFYNRTVAHDTQLAGYANGAYALTPHLTLEAGLRFSWTQFKFDNMADGPENFGPSGGSGRKSETPFTPRVGVNYHTDSGQLYYASIGRGYRIGGANAPFPASSCQADLTLLGLSQVPSSYGSDTNTSYEVGAKNNLFGGSVSLASSAFYIDWDRIQQSNYLPSCGFQYTANLGQAVSKGFDLQAEFRPFPSFSLTAAVSYTDARYSADTRSGPNPGAALIVADGDSLGGAPWTLAIGAQYDFAVGDMPAYLRGDYTYASRNRSLLPSQDPATASFDPVLSSDPATSYVDAHLGAIVGDWNIALIAMNLLNSHPQLGLNHQDAATALLEASSFKPRSIGLALTYKTP